LAAFLTIARLQSVHRFFPSLMKQRSKGGLFKFTVSSTTLSATSLNSHKNSPLPLLTNEEWFHQLFDGMKGQVSVESLKLNQGKRFLIHDPSITMRNPYLGNYDELREKVKQSLLRHPNLRFKTCMFSKVNITCLNYISFVPLIFLISIVNRFRWW
jgi:hypothetical protein